MRTTHQNTEKLAQQRRNVKICIMRFTQLKLSCSIYRGGGVCNKPKCTYTFKYIINHQYWGPYHTVLINLSFYDSFRRLPLWVYSPIHWITIIIIISLSLSKPSSLWLAWTASLDGNARDIHWKNIYSSFTSVSLNYFVANLVPSRTDSDDNYMYWIEHSVDRM